MFLDYVSTLQNSIKGPPVPRAIPQTRSPAAPWTPDDDARAASLWRQGVSGGAIARALAAAGGAERSASAVIGRMRRLHVVGGHPRAAADAVAVRREKAAAERKDCAVRRERDRATREAAGAPRLVTAVWAPPRPKARVPEGTPLPESLRVRIVDATAGQCRYIEGDGPAGICCGHRILPGSAYCPGHHALCTETKSRRTGPPATFSFRLRTRAA